MDDAWIESVRIAMEPIEGMRYSVDQTHDCIEYTLPRVALGWKLGLLDDSGVVLIELARLRGETALDPPEAELALLLSDELESVGRILGAIRVTVDTTDLYWFRAIVTLLLKRWKGGSGEPLLEFEELVGAWGTAAEDAVAALAPRGIDAFYTGRGATRRFVGRVRRWVAGSVSGLP